MPPTLGATRITFSAPPVKVRAAAGDAGDGEAPPNRSIEGVLLPYGVEGRAMDGVLYVFEAGSLTPMRDRTPLLLGHDRNRPVGVMAMLSSSETEARATFTVDPTPDGDQAIVQAQSGSRAALSVGAQPTQYQLDESGSELVVRVQAADLIDASLVTTGAFAGADVTDVAAQAGTQQGGTIMPPENGANANGTAVAPPALVESTAPPAGDAVQAGNPAAGVELAAGHPPIVIAERGRAPMRAGALVQLIVAAQHGDPQARRQLVEAALVESISTDVSGLLPPSYEREVIGGQDNARPLFDTFRSKSLPGVGLMVSKPKWITRPDGQWATDVNADAHSTKVQIGAQTADVIRWDWAGAFPWVVVQRSSPDLIDEVYAEAVQDWYLDVEAKVYGEIGAAAAGTSTTLGAAIAEFWTATGNRTAPDVIIMAPDVWGAFADVGQLNVALAQGASSAAGGLSTSFAGIRAVISGTLAPGEVILATRRALDVRVTEPVRLTANAIGALNVELAVVGEGLFDTDYPAELLKFAAITPTAPALASSRRSSS